ncbi:XS domain [Dillenia turbinata]|uniref:XS domain n=1 Tax=Dillenia turbinata TaxID=194707 RepID=A0AAN8VTL9_9MAGN
MSRRDVNQIIKEMWRVIGAETQMRNACTRMMKVGFCQNVLKRLRLMVSITYVRKERGAEGPSKQVKVAETRGYSEQNIVVQARNSADTGEKFAYPQMGIVVNNPVEWHGEKYVGDSGFQNAVAFEKAFEEKHCGKNDYQQRLFDRHIGDSLYAWIAHEEDYKAKILIIEHLHRNGDLFTLAALC